MHISKVFRTTGMASCLAAALAFSTGALAADKVIEIKIGHGDVETHPLHLSFVHFKEVLEKESNGHFKVNVFPNEQMGGDRELTEAVQMGNLTITAVSTSPVAAFNANFFAFDTPFMFKDRPEANATLDGKLGQLILDSMDKNNLKGLGYFENGFRLITNSKRAIHVPDDMKGIKLRVMQNAIHLAMWKALGANPTPMAYGEIFTALQQGTIDGQENPTPQIWNAKFYEVQKYVTVSNHIYTPYVLFANKEFYEGLSEEDKKLVQSASRQMIVYNRDLAAKRAQECLDNIGKAGLEIIELKPEEVAQFREKSASVLPMIKEKLSKDVLAAYEEFMASKK